MTLLNFIQFFDENSLSKQNSPRWDAAFCGVISGAILFAFCGVTVCLCPTKGTPGLNELKPIKFHQLVPHFETSQSWLVEKDLHTIFKSYKVKWRQRPSLNSQPNQRTNGPVNAHLSLLHIPINMFEYYGI